ncbi:MAG: hypothetical protein AB3N24_10055, partial [Leisingera sp.]
AFLFKIDIALKGRLALRRFSAFFEALRKQRPAQGCNIVPQGPSSGAGARRLPKGAPLQTRRTLRSRQLKALLP